MVHSAYTNSLNQNTECSAVSFGEIDTCYDAGSGLYSATRTFINPTLQDEVRFDWYQCTAGGLFRLHIWEDDGGLPGETLLAQMQLTDNAAGWNHSIISTSSFQTESELWVGIREYTATQNIGLDTLNQGCSAVNNGEGWMELDEGNLAFRLSSCIEDNPQGCFATGCDDGYICLDDWENYCVPSGCDCNESDGSWVCDADCNGGTCFQMGCMDPDACNFNPEAAVSDGSCAYEVDCQGICGGTAVEDYCGICGGSGTTDLECAERACNMELVSYVTFGQGTSDITGFSQDGREFAVVGLVQDLAAIVDITDPFNPFEIKRFPGPANTWRDLKYWNRHIYIGTEADAGVAVISMDNPDDPQLVYTIEDFTNSHNIYIDADGFLYVVGANEHHLWIYDLDIPQQPQLIGTWIGDYLHDIEVYNNKLYGAAISAQKFYILDVSDKSNLETLVTHITSSPTHDCAVTYDENILITADETGGGHIKIWDITDYDNINLLSEYITHPDHSVHNVYVRPETNLAIISYYVDGTRVIDIANPENPLEVGYFDTSEGSGLFDGNWGTYAYLPSGYIISSDRQNGLFILGSPLTMPELEWGDCSILPGDVNYDGDLNILDIVWVVNFILGMTEYTEMQFSLADLNQDGNLDVLDLVIIANIILDSTN